MLHGSTLKLFGHQERQPPDDQYNVSSLKKIDKAILECEVKKIETFIYYLSQTERGFYM